MTLYFEQETVQAAMHGSRAAKLFHRVDEKLFARLSVALIIVLSIVAAI